MTHLDTADWRLRRGGIDLAFVPKSGQLVVHRGSSRVEQPAGSIGWPALVSRIPDGPVREVIREAVGVRALLPFATSQDRCNSFAVLNADAKTVARVRWREGFGAGPAGAAAARYGCRSIRCAGTRRTRRRWSGC